jgi:hypothetical protein
MTTVVPEAAEVRVALRRVRRTHSDRTLGELLTDVYLLAFVTLLYGGAGAVSIRRHLAQPLVGPAGTAAVRAWLVLGLLVTVAALLWHGLRTLGPLVITPAVQSWVLATPVDRGGWLRPPLVLLLSVTAVIGGGIGVLAGWAGLARIGTAGAPAASGATAALGWSLLSGAGLGAGLAGAAVVFQARPRHEGRRVLAAALVAGLVLVAAAVVTGRTGGSVPTPFLPAWLVAAFAVAAAVVLARRGLATLPRLDRAALGGGAQLATAAMTAAIMLDPSLLSGIVGAQRWRLAGSVHSRRFWPGGRTWVLLQADFLRQWRRRADVAAYAALALAPYATGVFASLAVGPIRIVAAYIAVDRLAGGLRTVARSPALRRTLGGSDGELKLIHLIVPSIGVVLWWLATAWCGAPSPPVVTVLLVLGILGAVYRTATRPPMSYDAGLADSPMGPIPTTLLRRLIRGPDLVAVLVLIDLFASAGRR